MVREARPGSLTQRPGGPSPRDSERFQLKGNNLEQGSQKMPGNSGLTAAVSEGPRFYSR